MKTKRSVVAKRLKSADFCSAHRHAISSDRIYESSFAMMLIKRNVSCNTVTRYGLYNSTYEGNGQPTRVT